MTARAYSGLKANKYSVGREIGRGGEGAVFEVKEDTSLVLKVYTEALDKDKTEKLQYMASVQDAELNRFAAWPVDLIKDHTSQVCGIVMKKLEGFVPLHMLFSPMDRKKLFSDKGYNFLIHVARNLATAFYKIHQLGIVIGDVNEANILVNANGMIALIDCDSFQVKNGNRYHYCEVGIPRYTPPELLERGSFNQVVRTTNTDSFSLATLIFQLLFLGRPPFTGVNLTNEEIDEEKAIKTKEFAYSLRRQNKKLNPAKNSFELQNLTLGIIDLFHRAFETVDNRPGPDQWIIELNTLSKEIITCNHSKLHLYPSKLKECPWCKFKDKAGIVYFLDDTYLKNIPELNDIEHFVNGFKLDKIELKKLSDYYATGNLTANPIDNQFKKLKSQNAIVISIVVALTIALCFINWGFLAAGFFVIVVYNAASPVKKHLQVELIDRTNKLTSLKSSFNALVQQHNTPADLQKYNQAAGKLTNLINNFKDLPAEFNAKKKKVEEQYYNQQFQSFLQKFDIRQYTIPSFGSAKKLLIYTNGIRTAADISKLKSIKITGIGPAGIQILENWQRQMGTSFTYIPDYNLINKETSIVSSEINLKRQKLEVEIKTEYKNLHYLRANILTSVIAIEHQYDDLRKRVYQAELDLKAFQKFIK